MQVFEISWEAVQEMAKYGMLQITVSWNLC
jgi:hypothetical protein